MVIHGRIYSPNVASVSQPGFCSKMYSFPDRWRWAKIVPLPRIDPKSNM
jgi:hypothetical protein